MAYDDAESFNGTSLEDGNERAINGVLHKLGTLFLTVIISMNICLSILSIPKCMSSSIASWKKGMMRQLV